MVFCSNCGTKAIAGGKFCGKCGAPLAGAPSAPASQQVRNSDACSGHQRLPGWAMLMIHSFMQQQSQQAPPGHFMVQLPANVAPGQQMRVQVPAGYPQAGQTTMFRVPNGT